MKLKTEQEIGFMACEYTDNNQKHRPQIAWVLFDVKEAYKKAYTQAQFDMIESASEGFEEWWKNQDSVSYPLSLEKAWQAATLASEKEIQKLQKENERLKYELKLGLELLRGKCDLVGENEVEIKKLKTQLKEAVGIMKDGCLVYDQQVKAGSSSFRMDAQWFIEKYQEKESCL